MDTKLIELIKSEVRKKKTHLVVKLIPMPILKCMTNKSMIK